MPKRSGVYRKFLIHEAVDHDLRLVATLQRVPDTTVVELAIRDYVTASVRQLQAADVNGDCGGLRELIREVIREERGQYVKGKQVERK